MANILSIPIYRWQKLGPEMSGCKRMNVVVTFERERNQRLNSQKH